MAGRFSFFRDEVKDNAVSGAKFGAIIGAGLIGVSSVLTLITGGAFLLFPAIMAAGVCALSGAMSGGLVGSLYGALKGTFGRKPAPEQGFEQDEGMMPQSHGFAPDMQPQIAPPQPQLAPTPVAPAAPQTTGTVEKLSAAMERGKVLQARTAELAAQLRESGIGQGQETAGPQVQQQNWQANAQAPQSPENAPQQQGARR